MQTDLRISVVRKKMSKIITTHDFVQSMIEINPDIEILGEYEAAKKPILCRCQKCKYEWYPTPSNLKKGRSCPKCSGRYHRTEEEFIKELEKNNPTIQVLGEYKDLHARIKVQCKKCGKQWNPIAQSVLEGCACRECSYKIIGEKLKISADEVVRRMKESHPEIEIVGKYIDAKTRVRCRCAKCGYEWNPKGESLQAKKGCPSCTHQITKTQEEFVKMMEGISPTIEILGKFEAAKERVNCRCKKCGHEWSPTGNSLQNGYGCPQCANRARNERNIALRKEHEQFVSEMAKKNPTIEVLGEYVNSTTRLKVRCNLCGHTWNPLPPDILYGGGGCPECSIRSTSFMEKMILESFRCYYGKDAVLSRDIKTVGYELDIFVPSISLAIEPGSWFWHKDKIDNDRNKRKACADKNIRLIIIYDVYDEITAPFDSDCIVTPIDLGQEKDHKTLKSLIIGIFESLNIELGFSSEEWSEIETRAYVSSRKMNTEAFKQVMRDINPSIEILGKYLASNKTIHCRCKKCGHEWNPRVSDIRHNKAGCPKCAGNMLLSHEEFIQKLYAKNPSIVVLGTYVNNQTNIEVQCKICGHIWAPRPGNLLHGTGCPICAHLNSSIKQRKTHEQFLEELKQAGKDDIEILNFYSGAHNKVLCRCKKCGYEWDQMPYNLVHGRGCRMCNNT